MAKFFDVPFAEQGDKDPIPTGAQPNGSVSYITGYTPDYEIDLDIDDPNAKPVERGSMNDLFHDITDAVGFIQKHGAAEWSTAGKPYTLNDIVRFGDKNWLSLVSVNNDQPAEGSSWTEFSANVLKKITPLLSQPVGVCYTQYPSTPTPAALFGGSWKVLFADEGAFFRTEGAGASAFDSGVQQDSLKSHKHDASSSGAGGHAHTGSTNATGNHAHTGSTNAAGNHSHTRGTMNITGTFAGYTVGRNSRISGAFTSNNATHQGPDGTDNANEGQNTTTLDASRSWSGATSAAGNHSHTVSTNTAGNHDHTVSTNTVANHTHAVTVSATGENETRPKNRTIRVWQRTA